MGRIEGMLLGGVLCNRASIGGVPCPSCWLPWPQVRAYRRLLRLQGQCVPRLLTAGILDGTSVGFTATSDSGISAMDLAARSVGSPVLNAEVPHCWAPAFADTRCATNTARSLIRGMFCMDLARPLSRCTATVRNQAHFDIPLHRP